MKSETEPKKITQKSKFFLFDTIAIATMLSLLGAIVGTISAIFLSAPQVIEYSGKGRPIGVGDRGFSLTFSEPIDRESVAANLEIDPDLPGTISWSGNTLFYTLTAPPQYGETYQIQLRGARALRAELGQPRRRIASFQAELLTRDRIVVYLGTEGEEQGKIVLYNFTEDRRELLTPGDLTVIDFQPYPQGDRILFSAVDSTVNDANLDTLQLYAVTTGINYTNTANSQPLGRIQRLLDAREYRNLKFDLSPDGRLILVERVSRNNSEDTTLWVMKENEQPRSLGTQALDFQITPDSKSVAVVQENGVSLFPLTPDAPSLQFYRNYQGILGFTPDTGEMLLLRIDADGTRSLFLTGEAEDTIPILQTIADIRNCQFDRLKPQLVYCFQIGGENQSPQQPLIALIDLKKGENIPFIGLSNYQEVSLNMTPDGLALGFDQVVPKQNQPDQLEANLWVLPTPNFRSNRDPEIAPPEKLFPGLNPVWIP
ncbi:MAG: Ig-like domain-containing protein [Jaaginema sp. PMC 1079.18]|nr:Ig-like domain-containing protein [Jaaginema sp. PMC 1080.18]MEC4852983.1 Ig-like domain-containing protein [Jaaginema sp. PMC 1079.18]MEC4865968.1 Ig-like domain-containing protein [Jaaginema sp. PMC 1078.18]